MQWDGLKWISCNLGLVFTPKGVHSSGVYNNIHGQYHTGHSQQKPYVYRLLGQQKQINKVNLFIPGQLFPTYRKVTCHSRVEIEGFIVNIAVRFTARLIFYRLTVRFHARLIFCQLAFIVSKGRWCLSSCRKTWQWQDKPINATESRVALSKSSTIRVDHGADVYSKIYKPNKISLI